MKRVHTMAVRLGGAALFALVAGCPAAPQAPPPSAPSRIHGAAMPDFDRPVLSGGSVDTRALRGRVVVVKFFAEYCEPCKRTLPAAESLHRRHEEVAFIGISEDDSERTARDLIARYGLSFPVVLDRGQVLAGRYRVREIPVTFVMDARGVVRWVGGPEQTQSDLERAIEAILRES